MNRLTHINDVETYTYDPERGRLTSRAGAGTYTYGAEMTAGSPRDWLETVGGPNGTAYDHDAVGNVQERSGAGVPGGRQVFTYTAFDLPKLIESGPAGSTSATRFAYSASGSRLAKQTEGPTPRMTFYAGDLYQRTEPSISATPQAAHHRSVIYAGGRAVAQLTSGENADGTLSAPAVRYLYDDVLGSVQTITDASGAPAGTRDYEAFGKHSGEISSDVMLGFTGHEEDSELGLVNMKGRIYDPVAGQFLQTDPIMAEPYSQGLNRYAYVNNSPLNYIDPTGLTLDERDQLGIGVSAFGGGVIGGTGCAAYCGSIAAWLGGGGGAALGSAGSAGLSAWNLMSPRVSQSGTSTAPQQSRSAPASGRGVPSRARTAVSDVAPVREGGPGFLPNKGGLCRTEACLAENGFGGGGASGSWDLPPHQRHAYHEPWTPPARADVPPALRPPTKSELLSALDRVLLETLKALNPRGPASQRREVLLRTGQQLQAKFKHAKDFGVVGNYNKANAAAFSRAIHQHINSPGVRVIQGTYHKQPVTHYLDPSSGLNVMADPSGNFISGWKLSPGQLQNVLAHGGL